MVDRRPADDRRFEVGDVVSFNHVAYSHLTRGPSALAEMAARRLPKIVGQVSQVDRVTVEVIWETGRLGVFAYPDSKPLIKWTSTEVLTLEQ